MLQVSTIRESKEKVIEGLKKRGIKNVEELLQTLLNIDQLRKDTQKKLDDLKARSNTDSKKVGELMKTGKADEATALRTSVAADKDTIKSLESDLSTYEEGLLKGLYAIPNVPHEKVPAGKSAEDNFYYPQQGTIPVLYEGALPHWELIKKYDIIDFDLGIKISGAGFPVYKGKGAKLQRALINFFLNEADKAGYTEIQPPIVVNEASGYGTGQLPDKEGQMYFIGEDKLYLIPTAEVPITNLYRDVMLSENDLPIKNAGYTPCFRREAGSWGAHVRGLNRLHQFDKVEIVQIRKPE